MDRQISVRISGVPTACATGVADAWRETAALVRRQLTARFGPPVSEQYYDLFSPEMDRFPEIVALVSAGQGQVPLVFVDKELLSSGGKVSVPDIRRRLEMLGLVPR